MAGEVTLTPAQEYRLKTLVRHGRNGVNLRRNATMRRLERRCLIVITGCAYGFDHAKITDLGRAALAALEGEEKP